MQHTHTVKGRTLRFLATAVMALPLALMAPKAFSEEGLRHDPLVLVMLGDSITAGKGLPEDEVLPVKLQEWLVDKGHAIEIRNAGISGDTTAGGRERVDWSVDADADAVMVALGGNDLLRAIQPSETDKNLESIVQQLKAKNVHVILAGMIALPNYGPEYGEEFNAIYPRLADMYDITLYPFFLEGVAMDPTLNQPDGIHPNEAGVAELVSRIGPFLAKTLFESPNDIAVNED